MVETESGPSRFGAYVEDNPFIDGVIVLAEGQIIFESYPYIKAYERHLGWSITKVVVSTALAALESQGRVNSEQSTLDNLRSMRQH